MFMLICPVISTPIHRLLSVHNGFWTALNPISAKSLRHGPMVAHKLLFQLLGCGPIVPVVMLLVRIQKETSGQSILSKNLQHDVFQPSSHGERSSLDVFVRALSAS